MPLMGVCYGHQLMAHALGGVVDYHPDGREMGSLEIEQHAVAALDPWLAGCPPLFHAHLTHLQTILRLPAGAKALARSAHDPHQIVRYGPPQCRCSFIQSSRQKSWPPASMRGHRCFAAKVWIQGTCCKAFVTHPRR